MTAKTAMTELSWACRNGDCDRCHTCDHWCHCEPYDIAICGGCGAYGRLGEFHVRNDEECGEFV